MTTARGVIGAAASRPALLPGRWRHYLLGQMTFGASRVILGTVKHSHSHSASRVRPAGQTNTLASRLVMVPPRVIDIALAAFLVWWTIQNSTSDAEPLWATLLLAAAALSLVVRRRWPVPVLRFALVPYAVTQYTGTGQPAVLVALYTVASLRSERTAILATALAGATSIVTVSVHGDTWDLALARTLEVVFAALLGLVIAESRARRARETEMRAQIAASDERVRIARDLHDVVAHHLA